MKIVKFFDGLKKETPKQVLTLLITVGLGFGGGWIGARSYINENLDQHRQVITSEEELISRIAEEVGVSVVSVNVVSTESTEDFFGMPRQFEQESAGTGVILTADGVVATNRHVVGRESAKVTVTLSDGTKLDDVSIIGITNDSDPLDIAFLKINDLKDKNLSPAKLGKSADVKVGDRVIAIGNALGQFRNTVTSGIISGFGREIEALDSGGSHDTLLNLFQTDASINPGNSGGPLVNMAGEVIGINTAVAGEAENIGFAIPIDDLRPLIATVLDKGKLEQPYLGVRYVSITDDLAFEQDLPVNRGAFIVPESEGQPSVIPGSPAAKAGIKAGDIITKIDGEEINERNSLVSIIGRKSTDAEITLTIIRDSQEMEIKARLEAAPE